jgi:hypothetical protein
MAALLFLASSSACLAGGPRFVTTSGKAMAFYTPNVTYYTDPGDLAANVPHAQADAMVAAAAAPWNVSVALLTLAQGGTLSEHISDQNAYFNGTSLVLPADAQASNYLSKPIAVIYDENGSVTDLLLGEGASSPSACHINAVTESVDGFGGVADIQHAVLVLNGRCVGSNPQQLSQMQYQLERAFGRVLGLAWSQLNDNVFTVATTVRLHADRDGARGGYDSQRERLCLGECMRDGVSLRRRCAAVDTGDRVRCRADSCRRHESAAHHTADHRWCGTRSAGRGGHALPDGRRLGRSVPKPWSLCLRTGVEQRHCHRGFGCDGQRYVDSPAAACGSAGGEHRGIDRNAGLYRVDARHHAIGALSEACCPRRATAWARPE